ncbi:MAG: MFS transporter [Phycisphaerae bacterium]|nr:MFS transporter [Phycisphaerae bacterium]
MKTLDYAPSRVSDCEARTVRTVLLRLIPFIVILYVFNYLDRVNVSFAKLEMKEDLGFSESMYGLGAGIFFISYFLFEIPSNLIMQRVGARLWLARIMITWGLISSAMMFVRGPYSFYALRFLLGMAEAGFAPGILLYLTYWLPVRHQAKAVAWFLTSTAIAGAVGSPLAGLLLKLDGTAVFGRVLAGWQWLFLLEGIPSVLGGIAILLLLPNRPEQVKWLSPEQQHWLNSEVQADRERLKSVGHTSFFQAFRSPTFLMLNVIYFTLMFGFQGINFWLPTIVKQLTASRDSLHVGLIASLPYFAAMVAMVLIGRHSDRSGERRWHVAVCAAGGVLGFVLCAVTNHPVVGIAAMALAASAIWSTLGPFWAMPPAFLVGTAAAAGIAMINSIGNLGGFVGPYLIGVTVDHTQSYKAGLLLTATSLMLGGALTLLVKRLSNRQHAASNGESNP